LGSIILFYIFLLNTSTLTVNIYGVSCDIVDNYVRVFVLIKVLHWFYMWYIWFIMVLHRVSYCRCIFSQGHKPPALWSKGRCVQFFNSPMGTSDSKGIAEIGLVVLYSLIYLPFQFFEPIFFLYVYTVQDSCNDFIIFVPFGTSDTIWYHDSTTSCFGCETGLFFIY